jgi:hypothetical protein
MEILNLPDRQLILGPFDHGESGRAVRVLPTDVVGIAPGLFRRAEGFREELLAVLAVLSRLLFYELLEVLEVLEDHPALQGGWEDEVRVSPVVVDCHRFCYYYNGSGEIW